MTKFSMLALCALPCTLLTACDPEVDELQEADEEAFGAAADGEQVDPRCLLDGFFHYSAPLVGGGQSPLFFGWMEKTSPNAAYSSATCGDYYVIQATNVDGFAQPYLVVDPFWAGPTLTQAQCPWTILYYDISIYYNGAWHQRTNNYFTGSWDSTYSTCKLGGQIKVYDPGNDAQKVQVAVKAIYLDGTGEHYAKVGAKVLKTSIVFE